jgi:hypothetical protein
MCVSLANKTYQFEVRDWVLTVIATSVCHQILLLIDPSPICTVHDLANARETKQSTRIDFLRPGPCSGRGSLSSLTSSNESGAEPQLVGIFRLGAEPQLVGIFRLGVAC